MSDNTIDQQFIEYVVKSLVGNPEAVSIERTIDEKGVLLLLTVDPEDLGRVIGKRGATAQSLRTLLRALGTKNEARYNLKIVDNGVPREQRESKNEQGSGDGWASEPSTGSEQSFDASASVAASDDSGSIDDSVATDATAPEQSGGFAMASEPAADDDQQQDDDGVLAQTRRELADLDDLDV